MTRILLIGPGAIGGVIAASLAQAAHHDITLAARTPIERLEVTTPHGLLAAQPRVLTSPDQAAPVDWVLVATKAYDAAGAAAWFPKSLSDQTRVAVLQNGVEHVQRFAPYVAAERIVPVMVDLPAERRSPGHVHQRGPGRMLAPAGPGGTAFTALFTGTHLDVATSADFRTEAWKKLCHNNAGALSALVAAPAAITQHEGVAEIMRGLVRECIAVGRAEGAKLEDSIAQAVVDRHRRLPPDSVNSLHGDRIAGRRMEIDARNGVIVRLGRRHGIATPLNQMVVWMLEAIQENQSSFATGSRA